jgi:CPA2 family monovalent cation:H+ antiporter-2
VIVIAISASQSTRQIVQTIRLFSATSHVIVRTRYVKEIEDLTRIGADEVIPEEFETSVEIFTRVLKKYLVPNDEIENFVDEIRQGNYEVFRSFSGVETNGRNTRLHIPDVEVVTIVAQRGRNVLVGKTVFESGIRSKFGATILAIRRKNKYITEIRPEEVIEDEDVLYIFGRAKEITKLNSYL